MSVNAVGLVTHMFNSLKENNNMTACNISAKICSLCEDIKELCGNNGTEMEVIRKANEIICEEIIKIVSDKHENE